jgi:hypothetical protein
MAYEIQLKGTETDVVDADGYVQEGVLTTFFQGRDGRAVLDSWARRVASYRTADIIRIRWSPPTDERPGDLEAPIITQLKAG